MQKLVVKFQMAWPTWPLRWRNAEKQRPAGAGAVDTVLELIVLSLLAIVQVLVVVRWVVGRIAALLELVVELGVFLVHAPS